MSKISQYKIDFELNNYLTKSRWMSIEHCSELHFRYCDNSNTQKKRCYESAEIDVHSNENETQLRKQTAEMQLRNKSNENEHFIGHYVPFNIWTSTVADVELMIEHA